MKKIISFISVVIMLTLSISLYAKVTLAVAIPSNANSVKTVKELSAIYMKKHPNVKINIFNLPNNASDQYGVYLQTFQAKSGDIDVMNIDGIWPGDLAGNLLNLNKYGAKKLTDTMFKSMVAQGVVNDRQVALPWYADSPALYYRTDLLKKYHLKVPKTWNELARDAYIIQQGERKSGNPDFVGYVWEGSAYEGLTCCALEWIYSDGGGTIVSKNKKVTLDNPNAVKAINMARSWIGTISPEGVTSMKEEQARNVFEGGNAAFMRNWQYAYVLCNSKESRIRGKFSICRLPEGTAGISANTSGLEMIGVNKYTKHPKIATDFAIFLCSKEAQKLRALQVGYCPTIKSLYKDNDLIKKSDYFKLFYDIFMHAVNRPAVQTAPNYNAVSHIFYNAVYSVLIGNNNASSALAVAARQISKVTGYPLGKPETSKALK
ncbi:MAG TPA: ABC transporter substrate-binding protein [Victivallales bacterium]|nr:ABC transporter substrate-binding protein [Victivallales bacterium]